MAEYIEREAAKDAVTEVYYDTPEVNLSAEKFEAAINAIPAAAVAPVVHGRWVTHYRSGTPVAEGYVSTCCDMWNNRKSNYCPNCGAKMDGGESDEGD